MSVGRSRHLCLLSLPKLTALLPLFTVEDLLDAFRALKDLPEPFDFAALRSRNAMRSASSVPLTNVDLLFEAALACSSFLFASAMMLFPVVAEEEVEEEEETAAGEEEEGEEVEFTFRDFLRLKERCFSFSFCLLKNRCWSFFSSESSDLTIVSRTSLDGTSPRDTLLMCDAFAHF